MKTTFLQLLILLVLIVPIVTIAQNYDCTPVVQFSCSKDKCDKTTENFQHAEHFYYNKDSRKLSACLWTNCYSGTATVLEYKDSGEFTAIGKLKPDHSPNNYNPMIISITIGKQGNFNAIWGYGSQGLTFDMGKCN
jgi:hypothetical protein